MKQKIKAIIKRVRDFLLIPIKTFRRKKLKNADFTIISNNCWGGFVYKWFNLPYKTPTVGMYFFGEEYIKFCSDLKYYINCEMTFRQLEDSIYYEDIIKTGARPLIGLLDDVEIVLLHFKSKEEAIEKWNRRRERINWDYLIVKFNDQNLCNYDLLRKFNDLDIKNKICFTAREYKELDCCIWIKEDATKECVQNDTQSSNKYFNVLSYLNSIV